MSFTNSDLIVETLESAGVRRVYGLPGNSLNGFTDALRRKETLAWEHVRREETAAFAAAGEAAITGELAVCAASCGPGNLHLINGLFDAHRSRVPVLAIGAHIPTGEIGTTYFQETHPQDLFRECSVYCELASIPKQFPYILDTAMRVAGRRPRARRRGARDDPGRGGMRGRIRAGRRARGRSPGADRPHTARQGVPGVRQPVRRRHDRPARLRVGRPRDGRVRRPPDVGHRLPVPRPGRQVVTFSGDGGVAMMLGDLITLQQLGLPVKVVVFNNGALSFVELEMKPAGFVSFGADLTDPNFAAVAQAFGMHGACVEHPDELAGALQAAFDHDGSALVEVMTARQELAVPPTITLDEIKGFTLYATRSVVSGRADELIDLARTNVIRRLFSEEER